MAETSVRQSQPEVACEATVRTQLFNPADLDNVKKVQAGYKAQPLSQFVGIAAPPAAPKIDFIKPLTPVEQRTSLEFFNILDFVLQFCPTVPSETCCEVESMLYRSLTFARNQTTKIF
jgi:hypothetical protein